MQVSFLNLPKPFLLPDDQGMPFFYDRLRQHLESLEPKRSFNQLQFPAGIQSGTFSAWKKSKDDPYYRRPSDTDLQKLAAVDWLNLTIEQLQAWRAMDEYGSDVITLAFDELVQSAPVDVQNFILNNPDAALSMLLKIMKQPGDEKK